MVLSIGSSFEGNMRVAGKLRQDAEPTAAQAAPLPPDSADNA
jgi:hypothetical protein